MVTGLFFGSFNPIHIGHLIIAQAVLAQAKLSDVWFVVSPQNPHKSSKSLAHEFDRLKMVEYAIEGNDRFKAVDIEFHMPKPSYTVDTLAWLREKYPSRAFKLIIGEDNLTSFKKWKNHQVILDDFGLLVYPRPGKHNVKFNEHSKVVYLEAPMLNISATYIRKCVKEDRSIRYLVSESTAQYIRDRKLYL